MMTDCQTHKLQRSYTAYCSQHDLFGDTFLPYCYSITDLRLPVSQIPARRFKYYYDIQWIR